MITRIKQKEAYSCIDNSVINDTRLDWKDLGLLIYLLSKPGNWQVHTNQLIKERRLGRDGVQSIQKRLQDCGYMGFHRDSTGKTHWWVSETPQTDNPVKAIEPQVENPQVENPQVENPPVLISTDSIVNTDSIVSTEATPKKINPDWQPNAKSVEWVKTYGVTLEQAKPLVMNFVDYWLQTTTRRKDWNRSFRQNGIVQSGLLRIKKSGAHNENSRTNGKDRNQVSADLYRDLYQDAVARESGHSSVGEAAYQVQGPVDEASWN